MKLTYIPAIVLFYHGAKVCREWPVSLCECNHRLMQDFIDMLLELDDGFVIIDHKIFPRAHAEERAREYAPSLPLIAVRLKRYF